MVQGKPGTPLLLEDGIMEVHGPDLSQVKSSSANSNSLSQWLSSKLSDYFLHVEQEKVKRFNQPKESS